MKKFLKLYAPDGAGGGEPPANTPGAGGNTPPENTTPATFESIIPEEFRSKGYLKDFIGKPVAPETYNALFKKMDGLEQLIGRKTVGVPESAAPAEEWDKFFEKLRPADGKEYEIIQPEGQADEALAQNLREIFHKSGLSREQAKRLQEGYNSLMAPKLQELQKKNEAVEAEFAKLTSEVFGADKDKALEKTKQMLAQYAPEQAKKFMGELDNKSLVVLASVMNAMHNKFVAEDGGAPRGNDGAPMATKDEVRGALHKELMSPEFANVMHPEHANAKARAAVLARKLSEFE